MGYKPRPEQQAILARAMEHIRAVPYKVTARWLFYRLLQDALYKGKGDYHSQFLPLLSKTRKGFYGEWRPWTLADDTRAVVPGGNGFNTPLDWLEAVGELEFKKAKWLSQSHYLEVWFEAAAMAGQFRHYTQELPLLAFRGDVSIPEKWEAAKRLEEAHQAYGLPVVVIYFGDDDPKGWEIPEAALADIRRWCQVDFEFVRGGLNRGDGARLGIPENPDKPGAYQWEALSDKQAGDLITGTVGRYYDFSALADIEAEEGEITEKFRLRFEDFVKQWE